MRYLKKTQVATGQADPSAQSRPASSSDSSTSESSNTLENDYRQLLEKCDEYENLNAELMEEVRVMETNVTQVTKDMELKEKQGEIVQGTHAKQVRGLQKNMTNMKRMADRARVLVFQGRRDCGRWWVDIDRKQPKVKPYRECSAAYQRNLVQGPLWKQFNFIKEGLGGPDDIIGGSAMRSPAVLLRVQVCQLSVGGPGPKTVWRPLALEVGVAKAVCQ